MGGEAGPAYTQCGFIGCADGGCTTLPEGPSTCGPACTAQSTCVLGTICSTQTLYSAVGGFCVSGCNTNADCAGQPGTVCSQCAQSCVPAGNTSANIGDACTTSADCPTGGECESEFFPNGYCTLACTPGSAAGTACSCPSGSTCVDLLEEADCLETCSEPGTPCSRSGYLCQPLEGSSGGACQPPCQLFMGIDTCMYSGAPPSDACDTNSGYCGGPAVVDAGVVDAGRVVDAGPVDAGAPQDAGPAEVDAGPPAPTKNGCSCAPGTGSPDVMTALLGLAALARRRRRI
jgi:MYXO-CTERM domain-containing protein